MLKPLITVEEAASLLGMKPSTLYEWARMGYIPHTRLDVGKARSSVRFDPDEIAQWRKARDRPGRTTRVPKT